MTPQPRLAPPPADDAPREVAVVVPTCGRPHLLVRCLDAVLRQTLAAERFEVIVVDDGHDDATEALVGQLALRQPGALLRYLRPPRGRGPAVARNCGWQAARAPIVAFTDDDTLPDPAWLATGLAAMNAAPDIAALGGRVSVPPADPASHEPPTDHERNTRGLERTEFVTANAFVRRAALARVGGFDERFTRPWREDSDLQFRLEAQAGRVGRCEQAMVIHPVRPERWGVSLRQQSNAQFEALMFREHGQQYRRRLAPSPPWSYHLIVGCALAAPLLWLAGVPGSALVAAFVALLLVLRFAWRRLRGASHTPAHVLEMLLTSAAIPFLAVYWRLRGALRWRVWFL